ncbi:metallophosphoesterase [Thermosynechococcus sichuanensis E542]|uniref:Metallophosphoesterase n=1 Tax=Thermosynechococcus sichuanensis E542 TaxID=2016101 RepID=A0A3B7MFZ0_9CYAN|nr:metallophosphoesterase family protein [Thermosynechococcus vestitus]AXY68475.1 metallophosphoesterase [Thermosynechococcus vestitus E542]
MITHWAILSGIEGNLRALEAVLKDLQRQRPPVTTLYVLGDIIGLKGQNDAVVQRLQMPDLEPLEPQICIGWWEEQCFNLFGVGMSGEVPELIAEQGEAAVGQLWESISRSSVQWLRSLPFGFHELDCLLVHGSPVSASEVLTPATSPALLCDRLIRADANQLFCGRSGELFDCWISAEGLTAEVRTLDGTEQQAFELPQRRLIGVGSVGRQLGIASYVLYQPGSNYLKQCVIRY